MKLLSIFVLILLTNTVLGQEFNKSINKDSLLNTIVKDMPANQKKAFLQQYNSGSDKTKEFLLVMLSMPKSSKKELIKNIDLNYHNISILKSSYNKLVPANYRVSIEFNHTDNLTNKPESIDLAITRVENKETTVTQDWNLAYHSDKLNQMLAMLSWNYETLKVIKNLLYKAHCTSIANEPITDIGFARSGMGKYSYLLFDNNLSAKQIKQYNDGCSYIYYKNNIVLAYAGGAVGPQCFPDK